METPTLWQVGRVVFCAPPTWSGQIQHAAARRRLLALGVWSFSAECSGGGQPAGLTEGSRWSFGAEGERPPEKRVGWSSTLKGCQDQARDAEATPISSKCGRDESGTPAGVQDFSRAFARRSPPRRTLDDLRLPSGNPSGWLIQNVQTPAARRGLRALPAVGFMEIGSSAHNE